MRNSTAWLMSFILFLSGARVASQSTSTEATGLKQVPEILSPPTKFAKQLTLLSTDPQQPPPTDAYCRITYGYPCYSPQEMRKAYGFVPLLNAGFDGTGQTIVFIDSYGSPTIAQDLHAFDVAFGLPDPPSLKVIAPLGTVPFDPNNYWQAAWASETTLDVEWSHAMAPGASIVVLTSPVNETNGTHGLPEFLYLEQYALDHKLGNIIAQPWAVTENTLFTPAGEKLMASFEALYQQAAKQNVTVIAGSGDSGTDNFDLHMHFLTYPTVNWPASSPSVTTVGGTSLYLDTSGNYLYEIAWDNPYGATGGGVSQYFAEPAYQYSLPADIQTILLNYRGVPDVAYNGDLLITYVLYIGYLGPKKAGFYASGGGTSAGTTNWAAIVAIVNQLAGHPIGFLNPKLYAIGGGDGFHDIVFGSNAFVYTSGFLAMPGWDFTTGWGTPDLSKLAWELAKQ